MKITVKHNGKVMAIESADPAAGVPDTTQGAGPDLIKLQDDAKKDPKDPQAEFDATVPETQTPVETDDKAEPASTKANESALAGFLGKLSPAQKKELAGILAKESADAEGGEEPAPAAEPVTEPEAPAAEPTTDGDEGVGEVTQADGATVVEVNGVTITVTDDNSAAEPEAPAAEPTSPEATTDSTDPIAAEPAAAQSLESFFANLDLKNL